MPNWQLPSQLNIPSDLLEFTGDPILAQLLAQRGITPVAQARAFLSPDAYQPAPPTDLPDVETAVARLNRAIKGRELICVWGDFDVDGQTSTALLVSALQDLGGEVCYYIPNRLTESHGIKISALTRQIDKGINLLLTCDTGIAEHKALAVAQAAGVEVIVTDHHDLADSLPPALAAINPKRLPPNHPLRELPGVGVAYKLAQALYRAHNRAGDEDLLLDLVALGIVADVARQTGDTRYLLQRGLAVLQDTARVGLQALLESANIKTARLTENHIGFWIAPRLNALGRLGDANLAVELLTTPDLTRARIIALQLEALNDRRKLLVDRVVVQALGQIEDTPSLGNYNAIVLAAAGWHPGVIGIAASRLVEQFGKPAILIALRPDGLGRGSARSVAGCDIHQGIKSQANLLNSFGGHPMAAGLSLLPENVSAFRRGLSTALEDCRLLTGERVLRLDLLVELAQVSENLLAAIQRLAPFGAGNPAVKLGCTGLKIAAESLFGKTRTHKRVLVEGDGGEQRKVIWWRGAAETSPQGTFDLAFALGPNDFRGGGAVQIEWIAAREWEPAPAVSEVEFVDWRQGVDNSQWPIDDVVVWAEGDASPTEFPKALRRHQLHPAKNLVIWTTPPGPDVFQQVAFSVQPQRLFLVAKPLSPDSFPAFVKQVMGLIKYALAHKEGEVILEEMAAALGHQIATIRLGLDWLAAQGKLTVYVEEDDILVLRPGNQAADENTVAMIEEMLKLALAETEAYRNFFRRASLSALKKMVS